MNSNSVSVPISTARERLFPVLGIAGAVTWLGDFLFWNRTPGISVAIFAIGAAIVLLVAPDGERPTRPAWIAAALLLASSLATCLELSFSNLVVLAALLAVIMGERHYRELTGCWTRWSESLIAWACAGGRWSWLLRVFGESELANVGLDTVTSDRAARTVQIVAPAAALAVVFGLLLSLGNAVFRQILAHWNSEVLTWVFSFDFSPVRFGLWIVFATVALVLVRPRPAPEIPRFWHHVVPRISRADSSVAIWQSCAVFLVLNALFFAVNSIDVVYLWNGSSRSALPENVTFSEFVHQGVYSLIFAVLLSAVVITVIFQQEARVAQHRALKVLAWGWIAQNLLLIAGVFLRLKLYVDAYQLSELRVYVGCFLILVTAGFGLLALHIAQGGSFGALLWRNAAATFLLFFIVQFPDVAGWVARSNVTQWKRDPKHVLDLAYLESLGPGAWPALCDVAMSPRFNASTVQDAGEIVRKIAAAEIAARPGRDWRSYQRRRSANGKELITTVERLRVSLGQVRASDSDGLAAFAQVLNSPSNSTNP